jgi:hypothetical protein
VIYFYVPIDQSHCIHVPVIESVFVFAKVEEATLIQGYLNHDMRIYLVGCLGTAIEAWLRCEEMKVRWRP